MMRGLAAIRERIDAFPIEYKAQLLETVTTPQMRLRLLVNQVRRRSDEFSDDHVDRVVRGIRLAPRSEADARSAAGEGLGRERARLPLSLALSPLSRGEGIGQCPASQLLDFTAESNRSVL
jgi:GNAT superfamily N-acetyltransferase